MHINPNFRKIPEFKDSLSESIIFKCSGLGVLLLKIAVVIVFAAARNWVEADLFKGGGPEKPDPRFFLKMRNC
jgi:hypothetical protein